ncbi:MAG: hypothetical protein AAF988_01500 [Pseudomonadota bacterium]
MRKLGCSSFRVAIGEIYQDDLVLRAKLLIDRHGLVFDPKQNVGQQLATRISKDAASVSLSEMRKTGYVFNSLMRFTLIKIQNGHRSFTKKETEELEALVGDFFNLDGTPRHSKNISGPALSAA